MFSNYLYRHLAHLLSVYARPGDRAVYVDPRSEKLLRHAPGEDSALLCLENPPAEWHARYACFDPGQLPAPDYLILNGNLHFVADIIAYLERVARLCAPETRVLLTYYSALWRPFLLLATWLGLRERVPEQNWTSPHDIATLAQLAGLEVVRVEQRFLCPIYIPLLSALINRWLAPLPGLRLFAMMNVAVLRRKPSPPATPLSVSVVVPARNEKGNIEALFQRLPKMGPDDELILIEGHSTDGTWEEIQRCAALYQSRVRVKVAQQQGKGKADAVRLGFSMAEREILMILDSDLSVAPEDLPKFYAALVEGHGEFLNGTRLVYPMERQAMRFLNMIANHFFAHAFSFTLGQPLRDTLCGTKVLRRCEYGRLARHRAYFGEFDPFGDFDLLFGAARRGLKILDVPVRYRARTYGETNIQRWRHGWLLLRMLFFAARKIKFN